MQEKSDSARPTCLASLHFAEEHSTIASENGLAKMSEDSGGIASVVGINLPVSFCILGVGLSWTLQQIVTDTESGTKTLSIRVANSESAGHWHQWYLEGGNILHCWEK